MLLALLASHPAFGLRLKFTDSASTLPFSRLAQCSFPLWSRCSLIPPCGTFCIGGLVLRRYQRLTPRLLPAGATVAGWVSFLPLDQRALSTAHVESRSGAVTPKCPVSRSRSSNRACRSPAPGFRTRVLMRSPTVTRRLPSLRHPTLSAVSERFLGLLDSHQSPRSHHFLHCP